MGFLYFDFYSSSLYSLRSSHAGLCSQLSKAGSLAFALAVPSAWDTLIRCLTVISLCSFKPWLYCHLLKEAQLQFYPTRLHLPFTLLFLIFTTAPSLSHPLYKLKFTYLCCLFATPHLPTPIPLSALEGRISVCSLRHLAHSSPQNVLSKE